MTLFRDHAFLFIGGHCRIERILTVDITSVEWWARVAIDGVTISYKQPTKHVYTWWVKANQWHTIDENKTMLICNPLYISVSTAFLIHRNIINVRNYIYMGLPENCSIKKTVKTAIKTCCSPIQAIFCNKKIYFYLDF
jgi:hypothetical protein